MFPRLPVSLPLLVLTLLALSFQQESAVSSPAGLQPGFSSFVTITTQQSVTTNESNGVITQTSSQPAAETTPASAPVVPVFDQAARPPLGNTTPVAAPTQLFQRAEPAADNKSVAEKKPEEAPAEKKPEPAAARTPKCVKKTKMGLAGGSVGYYRSPGLVRTYDISELEQEGVSDSDLEDKLMLEMRRKCRVYNDWHYFSNRGDGKGATLLFSTHLWSSRKCVQEAVIEAGFPKDFKC